MSPERPHPTDDDRETLSALFDGELQGDAARFALKRLQHDAQWQQACGQWQLIGDALRGRGTSAASPDFAERVARAVAQEPAVVMEPEPRRVAAPVARGRVWRWAGGSALAASMALAAVLVARPPTQAPDAGQATIASAAAPAATTQENASIASPPVAAAPSPPAVDDVAEPAAPAASIAAAPARAPQPRAQTREPRGNRAAAARATAALATRSRAPAVLAARSAPPIEAPAAADPFRPAQEIVTRPWPRAVLPHSQAAGALTAGFDSPAASSPSFYPFEPRLQPDAPSLPAPPQP